jgi:hypothetical protein
MADFIHVAFNSIDSLLPSIYVVGDEIGKYINLDCKHLVYYSNIAKLAWTVVFFIYYIWLFYNRGKYRLVDTRIDIGVTFLLLLLLSFSVFHYTEEFKKTEEEVNIES